MIRLTARFVSEAVTGKYLAPILGETVFLNALLNNQAMFIHKRVTRSSTPRRELCSAPNTAWATDVPRTESEEQAALSVCAEFQFCTELPNNYHDTGCRRSECELSMRSSRQGLRSHKLDGNAFEILRLLFIGSNKMSKSASRVEL